MTSTSGKLVAAGAAGEGDGGITHLDYSRVHTVRVGRDVVSVPVETTVVEKICRDNEISGQRLREITQHAAEVCENVRQICVRNGNAGAARATKDALSVVNKMQPRF